MKKLVVLLALVLVACVSNAYALIEVGDFGETGWQTYSYTASRAFNYYGFLVTDVGDQIIPSQMLIDNVKLNGTPIEGFEDSGMPGSGWGSAALVTSYTRSISPTTTYNPREGSNIALLDSVNGWAAGDGIANTAAFGYGAVDGTYGYIPIPISLATGQTLTFDWAFMTEDYMPWTNDYCMFLLKDAAGAQENIMLANIGHAIPEPATMSLLGLGLLGLLGLKKRKV